MVRAEGLQKGQRRLFEFVEIASRGIRIEFNVNS
jgi:hypothetical protein